MTNPLTREEVEALLALEAKATLGPYTTREDQGMECWDVLTLPGTNPTDDFPQGSVWVAQLYEREDAEFLIAARNLIRPLAEAYLATLDAQNNLRGESATVARTITAVHPVVGSGEQEDPTLIARREGEREALRGMREWCDELRRGMEGCADNWCKGQHRASERAITEIDRRLAEGKTT